MRPRVAVVPLSVLAVLLALALAVPAVRGQDASPAAGSSAAGLDDAGGSVLIRFSLPEIAPDRAATIGLARTVVEPGGSLRLVAGAGPTVVFVASGAFLVRPTAPPDPLLVAADADAAATPAPIPAGEERELAAGAALILPAGGAAELHNGGDVPAVTVDLLAATDATREADAGNTMLATSQRPVTLPEAPVEVTLATTTIPPGDQLELPPVAGETVVAAVDPGQIILVTGRNFNRSQKPVPVYVLTIVENGAEGGTPTP